MNRPAHMRSRLSRWFERSLYVIAIAVPSIYFTHGWLPIDRWLERYSLRSPVVVNEAAHTPPTKSQNAPATGGTPRTRVYRCENDGATVWSDRPCGNVVETRDIATSDMNVLPSSAFTGAASSGAALDAGLDCDALRERLDELDARRRKAEGPTSSDALARQRDSVWAAGHTKRCW